MKISVFQNHETLSLNAGKLMVEAISNMTSPLLCFAAGNTPLETLAYLVNFSRTGRLNFTNANFIGLDEWVGMNGSTNGSCRHILDRNFFHPLKINQSQIHFFDGKSADLLGECSKINRYLELKGPINLVLLGIGLNGHIGFNEPGSSSDSVSRIVELHDTTKKSGQKYFSVLQKLNQGLTLGMGQLMKANQVLIIASGKKKSGIIKKLLKNELAIPASAFKKHPNCHLLIDRTANS